MRRRPDSVGWAGREIAENGGQRVDRQVGSMQRLWWKIADSSQDVLTAELFCFGKSAAFCQLSNQRTAGHGSNTSASAEAHVGDPAASDFHRQPQNIATRRIFDLSGRVGIGDITGIAGILKMVQDLGGVHVRIL